MDNLLTGKYFGTDNMFDNYFLSARMIYLTIFNKMPSRLYVGGVDGEKCCTAFKERFSEFISDTHRYTWYDHDRKKIEFGRTIFVLNNNSVIQFGNDYCEILHDGEHDDFIEKLVTFAKKHKEKQRRQPLEINLIVRNSDGLEIKAVEIKRTKLDLDLFYEDDFKQVDETIQKRLSNSKDKGIVLLHGLPGTGKTTYLRYLIGKIKKRVLFLSPNVAGNLMDPEFIELLINNPNTVVIIEDAENIIMDRRNSKDSSVSNLLNISDGLLADFLNVQLICTFNSALTLVDSALMRKGRLIAKYEFGKLGVAKAQRLSDHLGFKNIVNKPMTVAEISTQHEKNFETKQVNVIGFRRENGDFGGLN